jgi:hypothetical protein
MLITEGRKKYLVNWCVIKKNMIYQWHYMHQIVIKITCQVCWQFGQLPHSK